MDDSVSTGNDRILPLEDDPQGGKSRAAISAIDLGAITAQSVVGDLPMHTLSVTEDATGGEVDRILRQYPDLPGILITRSGRHRGLLSRRRLHDALSMEFGVALYAGRPINALLARLEAEEQLLLPSDTAIGEAAGIALARPADQRYDPIAVSWPSGRVLLLDAYVLLLGVNASLADTQRAQRLLLEDLGRARAQAERATEAKSEFLARMSHELRTPLNAVLGFSDLILSETFGPIRPERYRDSVAAIHTAAGHLLSLISDVLDISRIEAGEMPLHLNTFSVAALVADVAHLAEPLAQQNRNRFTWSVAPDAGEMVSDELKIRQCLLNLLGNAGKFTTSGEISLTVAVVQRPNGHGIRFTVADTGIGMTSEQMQRVLEPFIQGDKEVAARYGGTGLGLSICRDFVEFLGGKLRISSVPGAGTRFCFTLPRKFASEH